MNELQIENAIRECETSASLKNFEINLANLKIKLLEKNYEETKVCELFLKAIIFHYKRKSKSFLIKETKDSHIFLIILDILNIFQDKLLIVNEFLDFFEKDSLAPEANKKSSDLGILNFLSCLFCDFLFLELNIKIIMENVFSLLSIELIERQFNQLLKLPLIFSNFAKNMSKIFDKKKYYFLVFENIQNNEKISHIPLLCFFVNKLAFNGILGFFFVLSFLYSYFFLMS